MDLKSLSNDELLALSRDTAPQISERNAQPDRAPVRVTVGPSKPISEWSNEELLAASGSSPTKGGVQGFANQVLQTGAAMGMIPQSAAKMPTAADIGLGDQRSAGNKLTGIGGERYQLWPERLAREVGTQAYEAATLPGSGIDPESTEGVKRATGAAMLAGPISPASRVARMPQMTRAEAETATPAPSNAGLTEAAARDYKIYDEAGKNPVPTTVTPRKFAEPAPTITPKTGELADKIIKEAGGKGSYAHNATDEHTTVNTILRNAKTIDEVKSVLESLGGTFGEKTATNRNRTFAGIGIKNIKEWLAKHEPEAAAALEHATGNTAAVKRIENLLEGPAFQANLRTQRAGYGGNAPNAIRQTLSPIVEDYYVRGATHGLSAPEAAAFKEIVDGRPIVNFFRQMGAMSPSKGGIQFGLAFGTGGISAALGAVGNKIATVLTKRDIQRLDELIRKRSPEYERAVKASMEQYVTAAEKFMDGPNKATFTMLVLSSRSLANGFMRDGIPVDSGQLLRAISGPPEERQ